MAVTLPNGVVIPNADGREQISATGIDELRVAGASADSAIGAARAGAAAQAAQAEQKALDATQVAVDADATSRARDEALRDLIDGMEGLTYVGAWQAGTEYRINDVVTHGGDSYARLTAGSAGEPGAAPEHWGLVARKGDGGGFGELSETDVPGLYETVDGGIEERLVTAEDLIAETAAVVDRIKLANQSAGEGAPTGSAPVGWVYTDLTTGDIYRMEA